MFVCRIRRIGRVLFERPGWRAASWFCLRLVGLHITSWRSTPLKINTNMKTNANANTYCKVAYYSCESREKDTEGGSFPPENSKRASSIVAFQDCSTILADQGLIIKDGKLAVCFFLSFLDPIFEFARLVTIPLEPPSQSGSSPKYPAGQFLAFNARNFLSNNPLLAITGGPSSELRYFFLLRIKILLWEACGLQCNMLSDS